MKGAQRPRRPYPNAARQRRDENKPKFVDNNQLFIDQFVNLKKCLQPRTYVQVAKDILYGKLIRYYAPSLLHIRE